MNDSHIINNKPKTQIKRSKFQILYIDATRTQRHEGGDTGVCVTVSLCRGDPGAFKQLREQDDPLGVTMEI